MELLYFVLISIISYFGIILGLIVSVASKEELKPSKKYFILLHNITLALILFFFLRSIKINQFLEILLPLTLVLILFIYPSIYNKSQVIYIVLGIIFALSTKNINHFLIISTLTTFYGFLIAALQLNIKQKNYFKIILKNLGFFVCLIIFSIL